MREYKFRVWDEKNREMQPCGIGDNGHVTVWKDEESALYCVGVVNEGSSSIIRDIDVMQYTGLKDKHGVEIYEGDILSHNNYSLRTVIYEEKYARYMFKQLNDHTYYKINNFQLVEIEVIGNIYENPELLKKGNNK